MQQRLKKEEKKAKDIYDYFMIYLGLALFFFTGGFAAEIAVVSMAVGASYHNSVKVGIENKRLYCKMHGYDFICCENTLDPNRPIPWSKIILIEEIMKSGLYKWVFWSDADSVVMNFGVKLEDFLDEKYNLIIGKDKNQINSGQFFIKNCSWSLQLLRDIYSHTECIHHPFWEQQGLLSELKMRPSLLDSIKIVPQRLFNSYPPEIAQGSANACYQTGDFLIHFPGTKDFNALSHLMEKYAGKAAARAEFSNLDAYLQNQGFYLLPKHSEKNEGYVTEAQKMQFVSWLQSHPQVRQIAEIGLNAGHSAEIFFLNCPDLERFISFDIGIHGYTKTAREYFMKRHAGSFLFISGDSRTSIVEYACKSVQAQCDLIYIDGDHSYEGALADILNGRLLANKESYLWIDDYNSPSVSKAVLECERNKIIRVEEIHPSSDPCGNRCWVVARYVQ